MLSELFSRAFEAVMDASFGPGGPTDALFQPRLPVSGQSNSRDPEGC